MLDRLTHSLDFHATMLRLQSERQRLLASNIANADTPGYQARDLDFSQALRAAMQGQTVVPTTSQPGHFGVSMPTTTLALSYAQPAQTNPDGNTVDMDRERASFAQNTVKLQTTLRFLNGSISTALAAIKGQ